MQDVVNYLSLHEAISCKCRKKASIMYDPNRFFIAVVIGVLL